MSRAEAKKSINRSQSFALAEKRTLREVVENLAEAPATNIANASTAHALNATFSDTEVEAALNALGAKINELIAVVNKDS